MKEKVKEYLILLFTCAVFLYVNTYDIMVYKCREWKKRM
jgi:hypothetical protein